MYDKHFPKIRKKINKRRENKPWITGGIIKSIKSRNKLYIKFIKNPTDLNKSNYVKYRNKLNKIIKISCKQYYSTKFNEYEYNMKNTWQTINSVIGKNSIKKNPSYFHDGSLKITDPSIITDKFNSFFANIGPELASKINSPSIFSDFLEEASPNSIFFNPTDEIEILDIVKKNSKMAKALGTMM